MAKKATIKSRSRAGAKAAMAKRSKDVEAAPKKKAGFGKRGTSPSAARTASAAAKSASSKTAAKPARKSAIGKVAGAVTSAVSSVADKATSIFKRDRASKTR